MRAWLFSIFLISGTAAQADVPRVATDIAPVHSLVAMVMEGVGTPDLIIPSGATPHSYAMRPSEARALAQADMVIWIGPALTPWLADQKPGAERSINRTDGGGWNPIAGKPHRGGL